MIRVNTRTLIFLLIFYLAGYIYFFVSAMLNFPSEHLLHFYKTPWIFEEALRSLIEYLPVLTVSAVLLTFSTIRSARMDIPSSSGSISKPVGKTLYLLIFLTLIYSALSVGMQPVLWEHRHNRLYSSNLAKSYLSRARSAETEGDLDLAYRLYEDYLRIDKDNREVKESIDFLEGQITIQKADASAPSEKDPLPASSEYRNMTVIELLDRARESLEQEDPFTAHYLAGIILDMEEDREDAKRVAAQAIQKIESLEPSRQQKKEYEIYHRKLKGYEALSKYDRPVEAYYIFKKLREEVTADRDIEKYYRESLELTRRESFFVDDAENTETLPGIQKIVYIDKGPLFSDTVGTSIIFIDKLVRNAGDFWAQDVEIMYFSDSSDETFHLKADYAKLVNNTFLLKGIYRDNPEKTMEPVIDSTTEIPELYTVIPVSPSIVQLIRLSRQQDFLYQLNLPDLIQILPQIEQFGYPGVQFQILLLLRLLKPFLFLILSILAIGTGWRLRIRGNTFPWLLIWVIPLVPFAMRLILYMIEFAHQIVLTAAVMKGGLYLGSGVLLFLEALLLFFALLPIAMQKEL